MGKRGGVRSSSGRNRNVLLRRLESSFKNGNYGTLDEIINCLRSNYPDYARTKQQVLARQVQRALEESKHFLNNNNNKHKRNKSHSPQTLVCADDEEEEEDDDDCQFRSPTPKKLKKIDESEQRLLYREAQHLRRRHVEQERPSTATTSSSSSSSSDDETDGAVSTSEDAIYGERLEPGFDLMRSMLRSSYSKAKPAVESKPEEKNLEMEEVAQKAKKINSVEGERIEGIGTDSKPEVKGFGVGGNGVGGGGEVKGKDGPMFRDLGGMGGVVEELTMNVVVPLYHPQLPQCLGVRPPVGILLHGPPGCGKTKLAHAIANETGFPFYKISATEVVSGVSGASEENIRELFSKAYRTAPSIVFIDEIDAIASKRENLQREMERRIVTQLMTCMEESHRLVQPADKDLNSESSHHGPGYVLVIGATNRIDAVDRALRRPGRFDLEILLGVPDESARIEILSVLMRDLRLEGSFDLVKIARFTPGFVGADLAALVNKAGNIAMKRIIDRRKSDLSSEPIDEERAKQEHTEDWWRHPWLPEEIEKLSITMTDFEEAIKMVQPSTQREGFSTIPDVKWEDVGGLDFLRREFDRSIVRRIKYPEVYEEFGVDLGTGFLLYGPPGCGKTLIAKAVANEAGANFIHIKGPELLNKYVGESELAVRTIFSRARMCSPCILFFDEVDALTKERGKERGPVVDQLLNQLLIELDGGDERRGVFVIGATNKPEAMDRAILRPGRFGKLLYVPLPSPDERGSILKALARKKPVDGDVDLANIGQMEACENMSGADLSELMHEAAMAAVEDKLLAVDTSSDAAPCTIKLKHFEQALRKVAPSVSDEEKLHYRTLSKHFRAA